MISLVSLLFSLQIISATKVDGISFTFVLCKRVFFDTFIYTYIE